MRAPNIWHLHLRHFALQLGTFTRFIVGGAARKSTPGQSITPSQLPLRSRSRREPVPRNPGRLPGPREARHPLLAALPSGSSPHARGPLVLEQVAEAPADD